MPRPKVSATFPFARPGPKVSVTSRLEQGSPKLAPAYRAICVSGTSSGWVSPDACHRADEYRQNSGLSTRPCDTDFHAGTPAFAARIFLPESIPQGGSVAGSGASGSPPLGRAASR